MNEYNGLFMNAITQRFKRLTWLTGLTCAVVILGAAATAAALRFDSTERAVVLKGVTIGGVALDGMDFATARQRLVDKFEKPLDAPITVGVGETETTVTRRELGVSTNVEEVFEQAIALHGQMPALKRIWYRITGMPVGQELVVRTSLEEKKTNDFVTKLARSVNKPAKNASVSLIGGVPRISEEVPGQALDEKAAMSEIKKAVSSDQDRVTLRTRPVPAEVTKSNFKDVIVVKTGENRLYHYDGETLVKTYEVATGLPKYPTPLGQFKIINKRFRPTWVNPAKHPGGWGANLPARIGPGPGNPLGTRAMDLNSRGIRIHGTSNEASLGFNASHGCIRMRMADVEELFSRVEVGTPVIIVQAAPPKVQPGPQPTSSLDALAERDGTAIPGQAAGAAPPPAPQPPAATPAPADPQPDLPGLPEGLLPDAAG
ncbi:MAG: L,D-transpeptidase/peptidoglycan binding protein [Actinomycetota bacterium]|nr:L,D-transpeptidase/peptidoglycan binding protein [Actinomycetota bacterium]